MTHRGSAGSSEPTSPAPSDPEPGAGAVAASDGAVRRELRIAIIGAGPVGLDAALAVRERGHRVTVYEAAPHPAGHLRAWGHVRLFSPWSMNASPRMREALPEVDRSLDVDEEASPTGHELADRVLDPLWTLPELARGLKLGTRVVAVGREGTLKHEEIGSPSRGRRPFRVLLTDDASREWVEHHDVVLDCSGTYGNPNALGDGGIPAPGEVRLADRISRRIPDLASEGEGWRGRTILLVGAGHSAQTAARELADFASRHAGTRVLWTVRQPEPHWEVVEGDPLPLRSQLTRDARSVARGASDRVTFLPGRVVDALARDGDRVQVRLRGRSSDDEAPGGAEGEDATVVEVDRILALTGGVGDHTLYRQLQVHECYATSGPMKLAAALLGAGGGGDCLTQESHGAETLMNPEPDFFIVGDKSYGRNNTFLLTVGWSQVDEVFGVLDQQA